MVYLSKFGSARSRRQNKHYLVNIAKNFLIMLNNQPQMHLKLLQKGQIKNVHIGDKIANKITKKSTQNTLKTVDIDIKIKI